MIKTKAATQNINIARYLKKQKKITQLIAWSEFNVWRLASRISELRKNGMDIQTRWAKAANGSRYAIYELQEGTTSNETAVTVHAQGTMPEMRESR